MKLPVIVPLDGSASAEAALPIGAAVARRTGAPLHLIRVEASGPPGERSEPKRGAAGAYLGAVGVGLAESAAGGAIVTAQLEGPVVRSIVGYARVEGGMLVMAARGDGNPARGPIGEVTDRVVRWSGVPVVVVPGGRGQPVEGWRCDRILLVVDGSVPLDSLLDPALELAAAFGATVTIASGSGNGALEPVSVAVRLGPGGRGDFSFERSAAAVDTAVARLRQVGCPVEVHGVQGLLDARAALSLADLLDVDLIAVACADRPDGGVLRYGSTISGILRRATMPVLVRCLRSTLPGRPLGTGDRSRARGTPAPAA